MRKLLVILCAALAVAQAAYAAETNQNVTLKYAAYWGGLPAGDIVLSLQESAKTYRSNFTLESKGLLKNLMRLRAQASSDGVFKNKAPQALAYQASASRRKREKKYFWNFDPKAKIAKIPGDRHEDARIPQALRRDVIDPLSAMLKMRGFLREAAAKKDLHSLENKVLALYDGKRRFNLNLGKATEVSEKIDGREVDAISVPLSIETVAGFDADDAELWRNVALHALFSKDRSHVPLKIVATTPIAPAVIYLKGGCIGDPPCAGKSL